MAAAVSRCAVPLVALNGSCACSFEGHFLRKPRARVRNPGLSVSGSRLSVDVARHLASASDWVACSGRYQPLLVASICKTRSRSNQLIKPLLLDRELCIRNLASSFSGEGAS